MKSNDWMSALANLRNEMAPDDSAPDDASKPEESPAGEQEQTQSGRLDIILERKGRAGKVATIITGFTLSDEQVSLIAADIKKSLGTGGSARGGEILIQGDRRQQILKLLTDKGLKARII